MLAALEEAALRRKQQDGKAFRVIAVDSRPFLEVKTDVLPRLQAMGIPCTYIHINAISYVIREVHDLIRRQYHINQTKTY